ncbi:LysR family transcriptional regulator [Kitasatospora sp. NPDC002040]|uniref:LysR family transcriptional regulator n=1 Tax=Kitasatospora sp. NPDC002040 TaxID=3154661 RepID=UPI00331F84B8
MELELRHLRLVCAVAEAGSLGRAAGALGCSQPALSKQLQRIEALLGEPLFRRGPAGVQPTGYGLEVLVQAKEVLVRADAIGRRRGGARGTGGLLRLGVTNTPMLPGLVRAVGTARPDLALTVSSVYSSADLVELLQKGELDVAVAADYPALELRHSTAVAHRGIVTAPAFVALPERHRLARRVEVGLDELADEAWFLTPDDGAGWPGVFYAACLAGGFTPATVHDFLGDQSHLSQMIAHGLGVSVVQATFPSAPGVVVKPLVGTPIWVRYVLAWRKEEVEDALVDLLSRAAGTAYRELIAQARHFQEWSVRTYRVPKAGSE